MTQTEVEPLTLHARIRAADCRDHWLHLHDRLRGDFPAGLVPDLRSHLSDWTIWIAGRGDNPRIVLGRCHSPQRVRARLVIAARRGALPGVVARLQSLTADDATGMDIALHRNRVEYGGVVSQAQLPARLTLLRDLAQHVALRQDSIEMRKDQA